MPPDAHDAAAALELAGRQGLTIAAAESITGGLVAAALTSVPGASAVFRGGVVAYTPDAKRAVLGVPAEVIESSGLVSRQVAAAMATGAASALGADVAVATTGAAGPDAHDGAEAGTAWVVAVRGDVVVAREVRAAGGRDEVRRVVTDAAIGALCDVLNASRVPGTGVR